MRPSTPTRAPGSRGSVQRSRSSRFSPYSRSSWPSAYRASPWRRRSKARVSLAGVSGWAIRLQEVLLDRDRSLIDQSMHGRLGATTTNGDGFGVGWYDGEEAPHVYRGTHPAWNDRNL